MIQPNANLRFQLRAYENTDCVRLCALLTALAPDGGTVTRDAVAVAWATRWPRHTTGNQARIRKRICDALRTLRAAGIAYSDLPPPIPGHTPPSGGNIIIDRPEWAKLSASNLHIVQDRDGNTIPPAQWKTQPTAPEHLTTTQQSTHLSGMMSTGGPR